MSRHTLPKTKTTFFFCTSFWFELNIWTFTPPKTNISPEKTAAKGDDQGDMLAVCSFQGGVYTAPKDSVGWPTTKEEYQKTLWIGYAWMMSLMLNKQVALLSMIDTGVGDDHEKETQSPLGGQNFQP